MRRPKTTVYLAGRMTGLSYEEMMGWRIKAELILTEFHVFNPAATPLSSDFFCRNEFASAPIPSNREIVDINKYQILNSDVVLAELDHKDISIGTVCEIVFARENGKPVIVWGTANNTIDHPWIQEHITIAFEKLQDACMYVFKNYRK